MMIVQEERKLRGGGGAQPATKVPPYCVYILLHMFYIYFIGPHFED